VNLTTQDRSHLAKDAAKQAPIGDRVYNVIAYADKPLGYKMAVAAMAFGALTACHSTTPPEYRLNPHPNERYEITMTVRDAPGPLTDAVGSMQYLVPDDSCVPATGGPMNPLRINPKKWIRYPLEKVAENTYRAEVWADGMVDEDYYGLGICKWTLVQTTLSLKGASVRFTPDLTLRELRSQQSKTIFFSKRAYDAQTLGDTPYSGSTQRSYFGQEVQDELFTIALTSRRISP